MQNAKCGLRNMKLCQVRNAERGVLSKQCEKTLNIFINSEFRIPKSEMRLLFFFEKFVVDGIDEGLPTGLDDIFGDSNGSPF